MLGSMGTSRPANAIKMVNTTINSINVRPLRREHDQAVRVNIFVSFSIQTVRVGNAKNTQRHTCSTLYYDNVIGMSPDFKKETQKKSARILVFSPLAATGG
jgi:hypothetical protein